METGTKTIKLSFKPNFPQPDGNVRQYEYEKYGRQLEWRYIPILNPYNHYAISEFGDVAIFNRYGKWTSLSHTDKDNIFIRDKEDNERSKYPVIYLLAVSFLHNKDNHIFLRKKNEELTYYHYTNIEWWSGVEGLDKLIWKKSPRSNAHMISEYGHVAFSNYFIYRHLKIYDRKIKVVAFCRKSTPVNILVAEAFLENPHGYKYVLYKTENIQNNHYTNLEWSKVIDRNMDDIIWKQVPDFPNYICSEYGDVISNNMSTPHKMTLKSVDANGIGSLYLNGDLLYIDKILASTFVPNPNNYEYVIFKDGNPKNFHYTNLQWHNEPYLETDPSWKTIPDFPRYKVNLEGQIRSYCGRVPVILNPYVNKGGYDTVALFEDGVMVLFLVQRIIAKVFIANPENKPYVDHINRNRRDNRVVNLRWATEKENAANRDNISPRCKIVVQYTLDGVVVNTYASITEAALSTGFCVGMISKCIDGKIDTYKDYIWETLTEDEGPYVKQEGEIFVDAVNTINDRPEFSCPRYKVSNYGTFINSKGYRIKTIYTPYAAVNLFINNKRKQVRNHRIVAFYFVEGWSPERNIVNHRDENPRNCHHTNLEWLTESENVQYSLNRKKYRRVIAELKTMTPKY